MARSLKTIGEKFITFLQETGQSDAPVTQDEISELFSPLCTKIVNGNVLFTSSDHYPHQIANAREAIGKWIITKTLWSISSPENRACTIQFTWEGERIGEHTTMVTLFLDDSEKISEIHEVYNQYNQEISIKKTDEKASVKCLKNNLRYTLFFNEHHKFSF